ncbi:NUDIX domain-containing protein [Acidiferrobacter sp.]|uniref:NUDIX domain-containing protein n=1 Tax=Acidiferrobacter sp. TaxID=1872107 RepID=UPI0026299CA7|nr:NUDIX domain-containing protein [Acidiferrobacter sp.]
MAVPKTPLLTVDIIIRPDGHPLGVILIERRHSPLGWALPGGFVDIGERVEEAARREAREETGLAVTLEALLGCYSDPARDLRGHTVSLVYVARATGVAHAGDDAARCEIFDIHHITVPLAFDHSRILDDYRRFWECGERPTPEP